VRDGSNPYSDIEEVVEWWRRRCRELADHLVATGIVVTISRETVRRILHAGAVSWQATKTWKASNAPEFMAKMRRVLDLYDHPPADGRVLCVDEFGPLKRPGCAPRTTATTGYGTCSPPSTWPPAR
jgi:hypothetical protein